MWAWYNIYHLPGKEGSCLKWQKFNLFRFVMVAKAQLCLSSQYLSGRHFKLPVFVRLSCETRDILLEFSICKVVFSFVQLPHSCLQRHWALFWMCVLSSWHKCLFECCKAGGQPTCPWLLVVNWEANFGVLWEHESSRIYCLLEMKSNKNNAPLPFFIYNP